MKKKARLFALLIMLLFALHALLFGLRTIHLVGVVVGFLILLSVNLIRERPAPVLLKIPERKTAADV